MSKTLKYNFNANTEHVHSCILYIQVVNSEHCTIQFRMSYKLHAFIRRQSAEQRLFSNLRKDFPIYKKNFGATNYYLLFIIYQLFSCIFH